MNRISLILITFILAVVYSGFSEDRILVLREAKEYKGSTVAVEAYLKDSVLEVKVIARMERTKPIIYNAIVIGPKIGRITPDTRQTLYPTIEDEEPFPTKEKKGFLSFDRDVKLKEAQGTLTKELIKFKIPSQKLIAGRQYQIWVSIESMQRGGDRESFKFDLDDFASYF